MPLPKRRNGTKFIHRGEKGRNRVLIFMLFRRETDGSSRRKAWIRFDLVRILRQKPLINPRNGLQTPMQVFLFIVRMAQSKQHITILRT